MRLKGTLTEWNHSRGFGFIEPAGGGEPAFCHVSKFAVRSRRPLLGERLTYVRRFSDTRRCSRHGWPRPMVRARGLFDRELHHRLCVRIRQERCNESAMAHGGIDAASAIAGWRLAGRLDCTATLSSQDEKNLLHGRLPVLHDGQYHRACVVRRRWGIFASRSASLAGLGFGAPRKYGVRVRILSLGSAQPDCVFYSLRRSEIFLLSIRHHRQ